jgi:ParB family transcriptional regulator, chromosome partitioning protein
MPKRGLGRGLDALIPTNDSEHAGHGGPLELLVSQVSRNPRQPRMRLDPHELSDLAASIREHGVIQPIVVTQTDDPNRYLLIAGERRLEAVKLAGLATVPAIVRAPTSDQHLLELALIENIQRTDLGPLETALAYKHLVEDFSLSHDEVAKRVGKQRVTVTNAIRLLKLPPKVQEALAAGLILEGHARAMLGLPNGQAMMSAMNTIIGKQLNVRQAEELIRQMMGHRTARPASKTRKSAEVVSLENNLRESLGTRVNINRGRKGGTIVIHFFSDDDLNALADKLSGE